MAPSFQGWKSEFSGLTGDECADRMLSFAREVEGLGFESARVCDHLLPAPRPSRHPCLEAWTSLAALAGVTKIVRLGTMVTSMTFRNPACLAKLAVTVDAMSHGRLEFGVGAGWYQEEHHAYSMSSTATSTSGAARRCLRHRQGCRQPTQPLQIVRTIGLKAGELTKRLSDC